MAGHHPGSRGRAGEAYGGQAVCTCLVLKSIELEELMLCRKHFAGMLSNSDFSMGGEYFNGEVVNSGLMMV